MTSSSLLEVQLGAPAVPAIVEDVRASFGSSLPDAYLAFLAEHDGGEGFLGDSYVVLWRAEELVPFNRDYQVETYAPGIVLFGADGGNEAYGFDTQSLELPVVRIPLIGMGRRSAMPVAATFPGFLATLASGHQLKVVAAVPDFRERCAQLVDEWKVLGAGFEVVENVLRFMEDNADLELGSPGPLVHFVETFYRRGYEAKLVESMQRKPTRHGAWMLNRLLAGEADAATRLRYVDVMREARANPLAPEGTRRELDSFLERIPRDTSPRSPHNDGSNPPRDTSLTMNREDEGRVPPLAKSVPWS